MIDTISFGITAALVVALFVTVIIKNKKKNNGTVVELKPNAVTIKWKGHKITFTFIEIDGQLFYSGAQGDKGYSCSISTTGDEKYPWRLWAEVGDDDITVLTDIKTTYEII